MRYFLFSFLFFLLQFSGSSQKTGRELLDSLRAALPGARTDSARVVLLSSICYELRNISPKDALQPGNEALALAEKINWTYGIGISEYALIYANHILSRLPEAIEHAITAEGIFDDLGDQDHLCATWLMLAYLYKDFDTVISETYMKKATLLLPQNTDSLMKARNYGSLGNNYRNLGSYDSATRYMQLHLDMCRRHGWTGDAVVARNRFGYMYYAQNRLDTAYSLIRDALNYFRDRGSSRMVAENTTTLGKIRLRQSESAGARKMVYLSEAENWALQGLQVSGDLGYLIQEYTACKLLADIYRAQGRNDLAWEYLNKAFSDYVSVYGAQVVNKASILSWKRTKELKEKQVELLELRNRQQMGIIVLAILGILILAGVVIAIIRGRRRLNRAYRLVNQKKEEVSRVLGELEARNQELEAFSYSVSHDLRAPVRRIESLSRLLQEENDAALDASAKTILGHIERSTTLMNSLIEDMLKLSRITRQTVRSEPFSLSEMAEKICEDLKLTYPGLATVCRIEPNITVNADFQLLRIAMQNLLDNAWKYSSKSSKPEVTVGTVVHDGRKCIFVRDNGVGFDMSKAKDLFTPFQRFHSDDEFKGTGIGLATVKRIIVKHGGNIGVQSEPGQGTTFTFCL